MSNDLNRVVLIGRLTRDPEIRYTPSGTAVSSFSLANGRTYTVTGEKKEQVSYFDCIAWSKLGEIIAEYCKKGHRIAIEGKLQQSRWNDQDGNKRSKIEVVVDNFQFLTERSGSDQSIGASNDPERQNQASSGATGTASSGSAKDVQGQFGGKDVGNFDENPFSSDDIPF